VTAEATAGLGADTALEPLGDGRWRGDISERWWLERGPYGGFVSALLVRALVAAIDDPARAPRSITVHFLAAPAAGPVEIAATVARAGRSATTVELRMEQDGAPVALALAAAATWRDDTPEWMDAAPPAVPGPEACPELERVDGMPPFMSRFDVRWAQGGGLGQGGRGLLHARNVAWARPTPATPLDHVAVTALSDTIVPAAFSRFGRLLIVPTLDLTIHFRSPLPAGQPGDWALVSFESRRSAGGTWEEDGEVWSADGRLLAQSRQLAMIRERP
jgi:acyl-CoA thioesterase